MTHDLEHGRALYENRAWKAAYEALVRADEAKPLDAQDLERLATAAFMLGRDDDYLALHERAHHAYLADDDLPNAVRCAFWVGLNLVLRGEMGPGSGWLGRAQRLLERHGEDCVERAYLLTPRIFQLEATGDFAGAAAVAAEMLAIAERFGDPDISGIARHAQGQMLTKTGQVKDGLALMDEAMVAVTAGELSPVVTGIVYCGVILALQEVYEVAVLGNGPRR